MKPWHALPLACLLLAPLASAATPTTGLLSAAELRIDGQTSSQGRLVAVLQQDLDPTATFIPAAFRLSADELRQEVDAAMLDVHATGTPKTVGTSTTPGPTYAHATLEATESRRGFLVDFYSLDHAAPRLLMEATCAQARAPDWDTLVRTPMVNHERPDTQRDLSQTVAWTPCGPGQLTITGDLFIRLWEADAKVTTRDDTAILRSGHDQPEALRGGPDISDVLSSDQELFLTAINATLTIPLAAVSSLFTTQQHLHAKTTTWTDVHGSLDAGAVRVDATTLRLAGEMDLALQGTGAGQPLRAEVTGTLDSATADGAPLSVTIAPAGRSTWLLLVALGLVAAPAIAVPVLRRRSPGHKRIPALLTRIYDLLATPRIQDAFPLTRKLLAWRPDNGEAHFLHAKVLAALGRRQQALHHHERARRDVALTPLLVAENAFQAARTAMTLAQQEPQRAAVLHAQAMDWLRQAMRADAEIANAILLHPELEPLVRAMDEAADSLRGFA